ncbi:unnamed protein product [Vitrella brassicaformis CCMP3155]|uniref:Major facilitator superfamily (MFS) profile domain-containing protein n=1 Tax=Vitrella brassicaformis (strain CCMP3155) TaxID=1169540 RepID=A0A0G4ES81_VITBC|nr:unnamed protein product [Vitrella brassicaformis CCMP3155]|eukprot:CEM01475.1 unnamed protein product [Vitrella brassicaformis CCMP3155]
MHQQQQQQQSPTGTTGSTRPPHHPPRPPVTQQPTTPSPIVGAAQLIWRRGRDTNLGPSSRRQSTFRSPIVSRAGSSYRGEEGVGVTGASEVLLDGAEAGAGSKAGLGMRSGSRWEGGPTETSPLIVSVSSPSAKGSVRGSQEFTLGPVHGLGPIVWLTCFNFPYGLIYATMGLYILPSEALRLWPNHESLMLGLSLGLIGLTQLICPVVGVVSDNYSSPYGKRKPFIFAGGIMSVLGFFGMWFASLLLTRPLWMMLLAIMSCSLNVIYSAQTGLIPDQLKDHASQGTASGVVAVHLLLGSTLGFVFVAYTKDLDFHLLYFVYSLLIFVSVMLVCFTAVEEYSDGWPKGPLLLPEKLSIRDLLRSFTIDRRKNPDFFWIFVARTLYYLATSGQSFILYYLRDMVGTTDEAARKFQISVIALLGQLAAAAVAFPAGYLSEHWGRKILVYFACLFMSFTWIMFLVLPWIISDYTSYVSCIYFCAVIYGIGNGAYLSVDLALALDCLPDRRTAAKDLGIWGVSAFVGSAIGPLIEGLALQLIGRHGIVIYHMDQPKSYEYAGYVAVLGLSSVSISVSAFIISFVRSVI